MWKVITYHFPVPRIDFMLPFFGSKGNSMVQESLDSLFNKKQTNKQNNFSAELRDSE